MDVALVNGSAEITVPDASLLTPGQAISGTNIPTNTVILSIFIITNGDYPDTTKAMMSRKATNSGTSEATLTGSNKVGEIMQSEFTNWGKTNSMPT